MPLLHFRPSSYNFPHGKITPVWAESHLRSPDLMRFENLVGGAFFLRENFDKEVFAECIIEASKSERSSYFHVWTPSKESVASMDWSGVVDVMTVMWEACPEENDNCKRIKSGLKDQILRYINAFGVLENAGFRPDSGGMKMILSYVEDATWNMILSEAVESGLIEEVSDIRERIANGKVFMWAI
jgi:hypothetical protein